MSKKHTSIIEAKQNDLMTLGSRNYINYAMLIAFLVSLLISINYIFLGFSNYILDIHGFRQTQSALTSYYLCETGFQLDYLTPILGAPWKIPFEFPIYNWLVAILKTNSNLSFEESGRLVSITFFYLSLFPVFKIANYYLKDTFKSLFILSFILLNPTYLFWTRTFMMESTVLCLSLYYSWQTLEFFTHKKKINLIFAILLGVLAAIVKITTLLTFTLFTIFLIFIYWYNEESHSLKIKSLIKSSLYFILLVVIPFAFVLIWIGYTDTIKIQNDYAYDLLDTTKMNSWNYGTLDQKLSIETWITIFKNSLLYNKMYFILVLILIFVNVYFKLKYYKHALFCLFLYLLTPMIFTNLHFVHNYYTYSNSVFLCVSFGFLLISLIENMNFFFKILGLLSSLIILTFFFSSYKKGYFPSQKTNTNNGIVTLANLVKEKTDKDEAIFVYGNDWGAEYAFYSQRKTIALRNIFKSTNDTMFQYILSKHKNIKLRTLVFVSYFGLYDKDFLNEVINKYGFKPIYQQEPFFLYQIPDKNNLTQ